MSTRTSNREAGHYIAKLAPFTGSNFEGRTTDKGTGRLDSDFVHLGFRGADYFVYSYATPIAWHLPGPNGGSWVIPDARYSQSTLRHQSIVRRAVS